MERGDDRGTPTSGGWASPSPDGWASPSPGPQAPPPVPAAAGAPPATAPAPPAPPAGWGGTPGWGGPSAAGWASAQPAAPRPGVVPLRPLGLGELLDGAVGLVRGYPRPALGVAAVLALVTSVVQVVLLLTVLRPFFDVDAAALEAGDTDALIGLAAGAGVGGLVTLVVGTVSGAVMTGFMTGIAGRAVLGQPLGSGELWASVRPKLLRLVGGSLLYTAVVFLPFVLAGVVFGLLAAVGGVPGAAVGGLLALASLVLVPVLYVRLSLATPAIVLEDASVTQSFRRSWRLVRRSFWRVLGVLLLTVVVGAFVAQVVQLPFALLSGDGGPLAALEGEAQSLTTRSVVLGAIGTGLASCLVAPFTAGVSALLYVDRRMRAEGLDVSLQAAAAARA